MAKSIFAGKHFCRQKLFCHPSFSSFSMEKRFFPPTGKNLPTLVIAYNILERQEPKDH